MGPYALLSKRVLHVPYVVHGTGDDVYLAYRFKKQVMTAILRQADTVVALSNDMKRVLCQFWQRDILVIPNGVDLQAFQGIERESARTQLGIGEHDRVIIFVGRLNRIKGVEHLIAAFSPISRAAPNARLLLVGDGPERQKLQQQANDLDLSRYVTFVGAVSRDYIPVYLLSSDIFVLPSLSEGLPNVLLEAMAAALPVVATNVGGNSFLVEEGVNGFLVRPRDASQIASRVLAILGDPQLAHHLSANSRTRVQRYSWETVASELEQAYLNCLALR